MGCGKNAAHAIRKNDASLWSQSWATLCKRFYSISRALPYPCNPASTACWINCRAPDLNNSVSGSSLSPRHSNSTILLLFIVGVSPVLTSILKLKINRIRRFFQLIHTPVLVITLFRKPLY